MLCKGSLKPEHVSRISLGHKHWRKWSQSLLGFSQPKITKTSYTACWVIVLFLSDSLTRLDFICIMRGIWLFSREAHRLTPLTEYILSPPIRKVLFILNLVSTHHVCRQICACRFSSPWLPPNPWGVWGYPQGSQDLLCIQFLA